MSKIEVMSAHLANKIAAGEVVERPASIVKELVENSIDAHSSIIQVIVEEGGISYIKVIDNGQGMDRQDALLSFERHATSKLKTDRDLFQINTLGFRGEALPSIAAVSKLTLQTWDGQEETGTKLRLEGGQIIEQKAAPLRQGTIIEVAELFFNTPARYKYLKNVHTELSHLSDYMNRLALAFPQISFSLQHHQRSLLLTPGNGQLQSVISAIYGPSTAKEMIPFQMKHIDFEAEGFLGKPILTRANRHSISIFINGRYIKHAQLQHMILRVYHTLLPINRYPIVVLHLKMDPSLLDSNVHPAKLEVKLSKEKECISWLEEELKKCLQKKVLIPAPFRDLPGQRKRNKVKEQSYQSQISFVLPEKKAEKNEQPNNRSKEQKRPKSAAELEEVNSFPFEASANSGQLRENAAQEYQSEDEPDHSPLLEEEQVRKEKKRNETIRKEMDHEQETIPFLHPLAQLHGTYILAQNERGLYMIDQHAAQERIWFEEYKKQLSQPVEGLQELAVPLILEYTAGESIIIKENKDLLQEIGLFLEDFGHHSYMLRSHPSWFPEGEEEGLIREVIQQVIEKKGKIEWLMFREKVAIMMSCKQAIKANRFLTRQEMEALLEKLRWTTNPFTCPHGRPITILLSKYDIEKMFKRVMS